MCDPVAKDEVVRLAVPPFKVPVPITPEASLNVMVPEAVDGLTVAVKVTACPGADDGGATDSEIVVAARLTFSVTAVDVLDPLAESPP